jgi:hypothetical protein
VAGIWVASWSPALLRSAGGRRVGSGVWRKADRRASLLSGVLRCASGSESDNSQRQGQVRGTRKGPLLGRAGPCSWSGTSHTESPGVVPERARFSEPPMAPAPAPSLSVHWAHARSQECCRIRSMGIWRRSQDYCCLLRGHRAPKAQAPPSRPPPGLRGSGPRLENLSSVLGT